MLWILWLPVTVIAPGKTGVGQMTGSHFETSNANDKLTVALAKQIANESWHLF
jgi:hypothetical protein